MHSVLNLQADWPDTKAYQTLKETLIEACLGGILAHYDWAELAVVANKYDVLRALEYRNESLGFSCLRRLVNQNLPETEVPDPSVKSCHAGCADYVGVAQNFFLCLPL